MSVPNADIELTGSVNVLQAYGLKSSLMGISQDATVINGPVSCVVNIWTQVRLPDGTYAVTSSAVNVPWTNFVLNGETGEYEFVALDIPLYVAPVEEPAP